MERRFVKAPLHNVKISRWFLTRSIEWSSAMVKRLSFRGILKRSALSFAQVPGGHLVILLFRHSDGYPGGCPASFVSFYPALKENAPWSAHFVAWFAYIACLSWSKPAKWDQLQPKKIMLNAQRKVGIIVVRSVYRQLGTFKCAHTLPIYLELKMTRIF